MSTNPRPFLCKKQKLAIGGNASLSFNRLGHFFVIEIESKND